MSHKKSQNVRLKVIAVGQLIQLKCMSFSIYIEKVTDITFVAGPGKVVSIRLILTERK